MAQRAKGFREDTISEFLRHINANIPNLTDRHLELLVDYMKSVGATSEDDLYKMNEEDLGALVGEEEAKMIMRYCQRKVGTGASQTTTKREEFDDEKARREEKPNGASASSYRDGPEELRDPHEGAITTVLESLIQTQISEGEKNRLAMAEMFTQMLQAVADTTLNMAKEMREMTNKTLSMQMEVAEKVEKKTLEMEERLLRTHKAQTQELVKSMNDMHRKTLDELLKRFNDTVNQKGENTQGPRKDSPKKSKPCFIQ